MVLRRFTDFILHSRIQAMSAVFVIAFIPIIGTISIIIAAFVTLRKGALEGAVILLSALVPYFISFLAWPPPPAQANVALGMLGIIVASYVLTWLFAIVLRRFSSWNFALELAALLGVLIIGLVHVVFPGIQDWWGQQLTTYFVKSIDTLGKIKNGLETHPTLNDVQIQAISVAKRYATGFIMVSILFNALLQLLIARWWQAAMFNPGGLRKELHQIRLSHITAVIFVVGLLLSYYQVDFAQDAIPVLYMVFSVAALSLLHCVVKSSKIGWVWLVAVYSGIIWLFPLSIILLSMIGLLDTAVDFRKRFKTV